jgi:phage-related minor tail protein
MMKQLTETAKEVKTPLDEIGVAIGNTLSQGVSSLVDGFFGMKKSFGEVAADFLKNIAKMIAQTLILKAIQQSLKGTSVGGFLGFAKGGAFGGATGLPHGVYTQPTYFNMPGNGPLQKFAKGGVLGEAGPEAIMPLSRGRDGKLGVAGGGVTVNVINNAGVEVETKESSNQDGSKQIDIMIERKVKDLFGGGGMDKQMKQTYGLTRSAA